jgi:antitoxin (DNA-binding transcriptional repressor) of toxin-antitoxin stability system
MTTISIDDVQRDLLGCLQRVENGETLVVLRDERAVAEIKPVMAGDTADQSSRASDEDSHQSMQLIETSGALDFWTRPEEDVYSNADGEPL